MRNSNSKLTVLFVNSWYPNEVLPYKGNFIQRHAQAVSLYCNVICLSVQSRIQKEDYIIDKKLNNGVLEIIVYYKKLISNSWFSYLRKTIRYHTFFNYGYKVALKEFSNIDIVHLNVTLPAGLFTLYLKNKFKIPFIITEHSSVYLNESPFNHSIIERFLIKKIVSKASIICPVSINLKQAMLNRDLKGNYKIVSNAVNTKVFNYKPKIDNNKISILHISYLRALKNPIGILNVIKRVYAIRKDFVFSMVIGKNNALVENYIRDNSTLKNCTIILEEKSNQEIASEIQKSDIFLMFSNYENAPCVISEALCCGKPVLSSNVGGIKEMLNKDNGVLVEAKNENQLFKELIKMMDDFKKYSGKSISQKAYEKYSYENVGKQYFDIYKKVLGL
jgi:glycosyltransferase involved in cell wall biosynthesis